MTNHHWLTRICLALIVAGAAGLGAAACAKDQTTSPPLSDAQARVARLQRVNSLLQRKVELAGSKQFYLVLDPGASDITLMLRGAELQRYPVIGLQVGQPRVAWFARRDPKPWQDAIWMHGELDPPRAIDRFVIEAAPPGKDTAEPETPPVPPTPEELYPVPSRYQVRFADGRSIEVRPLDADVQAGRLARLRASWSAKWHDAAAAVAGAERDAVRLRIVLNPKDGASLYRSLPPDVRLVILGQERAPAPAPAR
ncbi:MAG: hypothetical protein NTV05_16275 [Acidobacteria bacterium]|nr:hypothetical protein [Acidobacteriota bacterium]